LPPHKLGDSRESHGVHFAFLEFAVHVSWLGPGFTLSEDFFRTVDNMYWTRWIGYRGYRDRGIKVSYL